MFTLPNLLTCCRLLTAPVFIVFFLVDRPWAAIAALGMAIFFEITDMLDGYIARRYAQVSSIGKLIDPLADSVARFSVFLAFVTESTVRGEPWPVLLVAVIFYRDATVACIRTFAAYTGTVLAARVSGKIKAVVQGTGILIFLAVRAASHFSGYFMQVRRDVFYWVLIPIAIVTAISGVDYVLSNRSAIVDITEEDGAAD